MQPSSSSDTPVIPTPSPNPQDVIAAINARSIELGKQPPITSELIADQGRYDTLIARATGEYGRFVPELLAQGGMTGEGLATLPDEKFKEAFSFNNRWHPTMQNIGKVLESHRERMIRNANDCDPPMPLGPTAFLLTAKEFGLIIDRCSDKEVQALLNKGHLHISSVLYSRSTEEFAQTVEKAKEKEAGKGGFAAAVRREQAVQGTPQSQALPRSLSR